MRYLSGAWIANKPGEVEHRLCEHRLDEARRDNDDVSAGGGQLAEAGRRRGGGGGGGRDPGDQLAVDDRDEPQAELFAAEVVRDVARPLVGVGAVH